MGNVISDLYCTAITLYQLFRFITTTEYPINWIDYCDDVLEEVKDKTHNTFLSFQTISK